VGPLFSSSSRPRPPSVQHPSWRPPFFHFPLQAFSPPLPFWYVLTCSNLSTLRTSAVRSRTLFFFFFSHFCLPTISLFLRLVPLSAKLNTIGCFAVFRTAISAYTPQLPPRRDVLVVSAECFDMLKAGPCLFLWSRNFRGASLRRIVFFRRFCRNTWSSLRLLYN